MSRIIKKPWGFEEIWAETEQYVGKILYINNGEKLSLQHHEEKEETIRVIRGELKLVFGESLDSLETKTLLEGDSFHIPPGLIHRFVGVTECSLCEVSTPQLEDVVRHEDAYGRVG